MQINEQNSSQIQSQKQQQDISSYPLPVRIKHPSWSARKNTYQQILYYLKNLSSHTQQIFISGATYTVQTLLPYFQYLIQQKHASVLLKGLQCVQQILLLDKKAYSKHCIKILVDKGIQYFPLLSQQRKAILQKFLDILELSKIEASFLKNKLNLPHQKSVMYVIEVIGVLGMTSLKSALLNISKKHQKKCVRQLALQISQELHDNLNENNQNSGLQQNKVKQAKSSTQPVSTKNTKSPSNSCKYTIQKLPHYEQLVSKKQQQYSSELAQKIESIVEQYTLAQLPNFSHILRLMIDDNNHIININGIKCLIAIFEKQKEDGFAKGSLIPVSFPLLFIFNKFKSHKTHPINTLLLSLIEAILQSTSNRVNDLFLALSQGLNSGGSKANVKFGCGLSFFRIISLLYQNQDLYACTANQNLQNQNQDLNEKFNKFKDVKLGKNLFKIVQKIMSMLQKDKKYETEMYLIKYAIGLDINSLSNTGSTKELIITNKSTIPKIGNEQQSSKNKVTQPSKAKKPQINNQGNNKKIQSVRSKQKQKTIQSTGQSSKSVGLSKTLKNTKSSGKFEQINLQQTLNTIIKQLNQHNEYQNKRGGFNTINNLLQKSQQQFYQCIKQRRYQMFYLCQLLQHFIQNYEPSDFTIQHVSEYLISLLKIISLLKPISVNTGSSEFKQISKHNVSQLLVVGLCRLVIGQQIQEVLQNLNVNYGYEVIFECLQDMLVSRKDKKIKKKNKKWLLEWLQGNTPAMFLNSDYYKLIDCINQKQQKKTKQIKQSKQVKQNKQQKQQITQNQKYKQLQSMQKQIQTQRQNKQERNVIKDKNLNKDKLIQSPKKKYDNNKHQDYGLNLSSNKKTRFGDYQLDNINLSKIQKNNTQYNEYDEMQKSSFHQNLQQHLRQIRTHRSYDDSDMVNNENNNYMTDRIDQIQENNISREYLKFLRINNKNMKQMTKKDDDKKRREQQQQQEQQNKDNRYKYEQDEQINNKEYSSKQDNSQLKYDDNNFRQNNNQNIRSNFIKLNNDKLTRLNNLNRQQKSEYNQLQQLADKQVQQREYLSKMQQVERRRQQRQRQRKQFMNRIKYQSKPIHKNNSSNQQQDQQQDQQQYHSSDQQDYQKPSTNYNQLNNNSTQQYKQTTTQHNSSSYSPSNHHPKLDNFISTNTQYQCQINNSSNSPTFTPQYNQQTNFRQQQQLNQSNLQQTHQQQQQTNQQPDCSFVSTTSSSQFKYKQLNHQKLSYMLTSTNNPYQHLRNLILIPFKSTHKKHQFLKQLLHFFTNHVHFKLPQPYTSLILLTILMFSQIKQDKTLIQPLQSLYQFLAKQFTTNDFIKTIVNLFHTVIQQTLPQNRKFLITILLKSMIRMLPFIEDGVSLLRDIQQFYQIGEMVYFQMFEQEYNQIRSYIQDEAIHIVVEKGLQQQGDNLRSIVQGWLTTSWKTKVLQTIEQFQSQHSGMHDQQQQHQHQNKQQDYKSII